MSERNVRGARRQAITASSARGARRLKKLVSTWSAKAFPRMGVDRAEDAQPVAAVSDVDREVDLELVLEGRTILHYELLQKLWRGGMARCGRLATNNSES